MENGLPVITSRRVTAYTALLAVLIATFYWPLGNEFIAADYTHLHHLSWSEVFGMFGHLRHAPELLTREYRPLSEFSYALQERLFGGIPEPYHAWGWTLHLLTCLLMFHLGLALGLGEVAAVCSAIVYALHPSLTEIVAWMCVQADQYCGIFYILSLLAFLQGLWEVERRIRWIALSLVFMAASCMSKEMGLTIPFAVVAWLLFARGPKSGTGEDADSTHPRPSLFLALPYFALFVLYWLLRVLVFGGFGGYHFARHLQMGSFLTFNLTQYTLWLAGWDRSETAAVILGRDGWWAMLGMVAVGLILLGGRHRFLLVWPFLALIPVYNILKNTNLYIPVMGASFLYGSAFAALGRRPGKAGRVLTVLPLIGLALFGWQVRHRMNDFAAARAAVTEIRTSIEAQTPFFKEGTTFYFMGLPDKVNDIFTLGVGIESAVHVWFPESGFRGYKVEKFSDFPRVPGPGPAGFAFWQWTGLPDANGTSVGLMRRPDIEVLFRNNPEWFRGARQLGPPGGTGPLWFNAHLQKAGGPAREVVGVKALKPPQLWRQFGGLEVEVEVLEAPYGRSDVRLAAVTEQGMEVASVNAPLGGVGKRKVVLNLSDDLDWGFLSSVKTFTLSLSRKPAVIGRIQAHWLQPPPRLAEPKTLISLPNQGK